MTLVFEVKKVENGKKTEKADNINSVREGLRNTLEILNDNGFKNFLELYHKINESGTHKIIKIPKSGGYIFDREACLECEHMNNEGLDRMSNKQALAFIQKLIEKGEKNGLIKV